MLMVKKARCIRNITLLTSDRTLLAHFLGEIISRFYFLEMRHESVDLNDDSKLSPQILDLIIKLKIQALWSY